MTILSKLREELEKRKQKMIEHNWWGGYLEQTVWTLSLLDSLEKDEHIFGNELAPNQKTWCTNHFSVKTDIDQEQVKENIRVMDEQDGNTWQPSPNEEIEVSDDGIDWVHGEFVEIGQGRYIVCRTSEDFPSMRTFWKFARPLVQLPELSEFDWLKQCRKSEERWGEWLLWSSVGYQVEALTTYLLALQKHPKFQSIFNNK